MFKFYRDDYIQLCKQKRDGVTNRNTKKSSGLFFVYFRNIQLYYKHELREEYDDDDDDKRENVTLEHKRLYAKEDLQHTAKSKPASQERLEQKDHLEIAQPLRRYGTEVVVKEHGSGEHCDYQRLWNHFANILHELFACRRVFVSKVLLHTRTKEIVREQKTAVDKYRKYMYKMYREIEHCFVPLY